MSRTFHPVSTPKCTHLLERVRVCPGRYLATSNLYITIVSLLAVFRIVKAKDDKGDEIPVSGKFIEGSVW